MSCRICKTELSEYELDLSRAIIFIFKDLCRNCLKKIDEDEEEEEEEEIPWCYENNKYAVCNCPQPCNPPSDDEEEEEEEENKLCEECGKPFEDGNWRRDEMCDCHQCDCGKLLKVNDDGFIGVCSMCFTDYGNVNE